VKLGHFGLVVDLFLLALTKEVRGILKQFLFPASDLGRMDLVLAGKLCNGLGL